jgi:hypothetical protein
MAATDDARRERRTGGRHQTARSRPARGARSLETRPRTVDRRAEVPEQRSARRESAEAKVEEPRTQKQKALLSVAA